MYAVFANQPSEETFTAVSDLVIENGGTFEETEKQIDLALEEAKNREKKQDEIMQHCQWQQRKLYLCGERSHASACRYRRQAKNELRKA